MKKVILVSALALTFGAAGLAHADPPWIGDTTTYNTLFLQDNSDNSDNSASATAQRSVALSGGSSGSFSNAFNVTTAVAASTLVGSVSNNGVYHVGNTAINGGGANGGSGGGSLGVGVGLGLLGVGVGVGVGGDGDSGGTVGVNGGSFSMDNAMTGVGQSAAGILSAAQNSGAASMVQQSVNVQANLAVH